MSGSCSFKIILFDNNNTQKLTILSKSYLGGADSPNLKFKFSSVLQTQQINKPIINRILIDVLLLNLY